MSLMGLLLQSGTLKNEQRRRAIQKLAEQQKRDEGAREVEYDIRGPKDIVLSGPLIGSKGRGRMFASRAAALEWAKGKYGEDKVYELPALSQRPEEELRIWAVIVKNLRH